MEQIRWGILSAGRIAGAFARDMENVGNGRVTAIAARSAERARAFADEHGITRAHGDYQALFEDPEVDAVYVATPHSEHLRHCRAAIEAGKPVLCEKPITVNPSECETLIALNREHAVYLMEGMWTWFLPAIQRARQWVEQGRIGTLRQVKADFGYPFPFDASAREYDRELGGGCLLDMGVYPVALAQLFLGTEVEDMQVKAHLAPNGVEDDVLVQLEYAEAYASLASSFRCKLPNWAYLIGESGYIAIPDFWRATRCLLFRLDEQVDAYDEGRDSLGFHHQIESVGDDLLNARLQSSVVPLAASLGFQRQMAAIKQCAGMDRDAT